MPSSLRGRPIAAGGQGIKARFTSLPRTYAQILVDRVSKLFNRDASANRYRMTRANRSAPACALLIRKQALIDDLRNYPVAPVASAFAERKRRVKAYRYRGCHERTNRLGGAIAADPHPACGSARGPIARETTSRWSAPSWSPRHERFCCRSALVKTQVIEICDQPGSGRIPAQ